jgi:prepilin-type N-terminal cleavage/methylation domain-containing protein
MKKAFTMIELIFVIIVIGILSAIALPKLSATRDDAKLSQIAKNISTAAQEITAFAISKRIVLPVYQNMSNAVALMISSHDAVQQTGDLLKIRMNTVADCITLQVDDSSNIKILTLGYGNSGGDMMCKELQKMVDKHKFHIPLKGNYVQR